MGNCHLPKLPTPDSRLPTPHPLIKVGWAKFHYLKYSKQPNCFCPPDKL
ncbi:MAG: hypothetical protein F6K56_41010 [Moorea sp. SIO3G5]|nr:hypothetical protein [Moorena sp. SIO3G5]